jgi:hypothetical protein
MHNSNVAWKTVEHDFLRYTLQQLDNNLRKVSINLLRYNSRQNKNQHDTVCVQCMLPTELTEIECHAS